MALDMVNRISEDTQLFFMLSSTTVRLFTLARLFCFSDGRVHCRTPSLFTGRMGLVHGVHVVYHLGYSSRDEDDEGTVTT